MAYPFEIHPALFALTGIRSARRLSAEPDGGFSNFLESFLADFQ